MHVVRTAFILYPPFHQGPGAQSVSTGRKLAQRASEKIDRALELKDEGNAAFRAEDYRSALKKYHHALMYTRGVTDQGSLDNFPGLEQMLKYVASEEDKRVANDLALVVRNNMSGVCVCVCVCVCYTFDSVKIVGDCIFPACLLKTEKWKKASEYASRVST